MDRRPWIPLLVGLALAAGPVRAQIVDTLAGFVDRPGWSGTAGLGLRASGGNTEVVDLAADARVQRQSDRQRLRLLLGYGLSRADGEDRAEETFAHLRHNHRLTTRWRTLAFTQVQANPFQRLRSRVLLGLGLRAEPHPGERLRIAVGVAPMLEIERVRDADGATGTHRLSSFLELRWHGSAGPVFSCTAFLQPRWREPEDLRASVSADLEAPLAAGWSLTATARLAHDSRPPVGVERSDWTLRSGLRLKL